MSEYEQALLDALTERERVMVANIARHYLNEDQRAMLGADLLDGDLFASVENNQKGGGDV